MVLAGSLTLYQGLTKVLISHTTYLSQQEETSWLLFCQQLRSELAAAQLERVSNNRLYVTKQERQLAFGQFRGDDFRKANADGRGYQPMLFGLEEVDISQDGQLVRIAVSFQTGMEREFYYAFP